MRNQDNLWDVYAGAKNQEPLQLAVRMAIESAILDLLPSVTNVTPNDCQPTVPLVVNDDYLVVNDDYVAIGGKGLPVNLDATSE